MVWQCCDLDIEFLRYFQFYLRQRIEFCHRQQSAPINQEVDNQEATAYLAHADIMVYISDDVWVFHSCETIDKR